jgi:hypothetical protein
MPIVSLIYRAATHFLDEATKAVSQLGLLNRREALGMSNAGERIVSACVHSEPIVSRLSKTPAGWPNTRRWRERL